MQTLGNCEKCHQQKLIDKNGWCRKCLDALYERSEKCYDYLKSKEFQSDFVAEAERVRDHRRKSNA